MTGCATPGDTVWYSTSDNTKRKYRHTWELTQSQSGAFTASTRFGLTGRRKRLSL
ncbi:hypothetical protein ACLK1V_00775 [Escherichia coli]